MGRFLAIILCCVALLAAAPAMASGGGGHGGGEKKKSKGGVDCTAIIPDTPIFVPMQPLTIPVFREGQPTNFVSYRMTLEVVPQTEACERVLQAMPRLQSAFLENLHALGSTQNAGQMENLEYVKKFLMEVGAQIMYKEPPLPPSEDAHEEEGAAAHEPSPDMPITDVLMLSTFNRRL